ncbi:HPr kinase/phosphorylase [Oceanibacterium hippocampi]|uniref:HPr kinase/phosphorylase n=1 Tax=Oceanibacterium hippocampi TaxID=745714 RepID=A0A1Y5RQN7_9PROT|nr:hypothetical protein [Oceanibacterium hippocampi]SLN22083.1 HPr kinase/phosphorylase [Oceanibacterium hippocampi]
MMALHGTCVAIEERGILLLGPSGSGKSDLALRLIDGGALLVADDQVTITRRAGRLFAASPPTIAGLLELRGVGIVRMPALAEVELALAVSLVDPATVERLPGNADYEIDGIALPLLLLAAFESATPAKIRLALPRLAMLRADDEPLTAAPVTVLRGR